MAETAKMATASGWARRLAEQIREQERTRQEEQERQERRRQAFQENAPLCWVNLVAVIEHDVAEFNQVFADDPQSGAQYQRFPPNPRVQPQRVRAWRTGYVTAHLEVWLDMESEAVEFRISRKAAHEGAAHEKAGKFKLEMDGAGEVHLSHGGKPISLEQASEIMLHPVLAP